MNKYLSFILLLFTTFCWGQVKIEKIHFEWEEHDQCEYFYKYDLYYPSFLDTNQFYVSLNQQIKKFVGMPLYKNPVDTKGECPDSLERYPDFLPEFVRTSYAIKTNTSDFLSFYLHRYWHAAGESIGMIMSIKGLNVYQKNEIWTLQDVVKKEEWEHFKKMVEIEYNKEYKVPLRKPNPQLGEALEWKIQGYTVSPNQVHIHLKIPHTYSKIYTETITLSLGNCKKYMNKRHYHVFKTLK